MYNLIVYVSKFIKGRGHTNYDIQIIVVILKATTRFFKRRPWIIGKIIMIVLASHVPNMNYEVYCGSASVELTHRKQQRHWIIGTFIMIVLRSHMFLAKFTTVVF